jgi:hypothetical protein
MAVRVNQRALSHTAILPKQLSVIEMHRRKNGAGKAVQSVTNQDGTAVMVLHVAVEIDLLSFNPIAAGLQFQKSASRSIV